MSTTAGSPPQEVPQNSAASPTRRSGKRLILVLLGIVVFVLAGIWLARWWTIGRFIESTDDAYLQADSVTVAPKVSGYVTDVYVGDNAMVKAIARGFRWREMLENSTHATIAEIAAAEVVVPTEVVGPAAAIIEIVTTAALA